VPVKGFLRNVNLTISLTQIFPFLNANRCCLILKIRKVDLFFPGISSCKKTTRALLMQNRRKMFARWNLSLIVHLSVSRLFKCSLDKRDDTI